MTSIFSSRVPRRRSNSKLRVIAAHLVELSVNPGQEREPREKRDERDGGGRRGLAHVEAHAPFAVTSRG